MELPVYNQQGEKIGTIDLPDSVFGLKWNPDLVHQVATSQAANARPTVAQAKGRGEVRGGGKKPWRQKGTGRARHGSIRSPLWKGGGVTHGPLAQKNYKKGVNKKMARAALKAVLSAKAKDEEIVVIEDLHLAEPKTKRAVAVFEKMAKTFPGMIKGNGVLVALPVNDGAAKRAIRNILYAKAEEARNLNAHKLLQYKYLLLPKGAIESFVKGVK